MNFPRFLLGTFTAAILLVSGACSREVPEPPHTPAPTPAVLHVDLAVDLNPLRPELAACAARTGIGLLVFEALDPSPPVKPRSVTITLGDVPDWDGPAALLGRERIVAAAADIGRPAALRTEQIAGLYTGMLEALPGRPGPAEIWIPLEGTASRGVLDQLLGEKNFTAEGFLAPDPETTAAILVQNPDAVGVLPAAWLNPELTILLEIADLPVLALTLEEPGGDLRQFLGCLQIENIYSP